MLAASSSAPKSPLSSAPRPKNWRGVAAGLAEADHMLRQHNPSGAEGILRQVLEFAPMEGRAWHLLGKILQDGDRHTEALDCFSRAESCYGRKKRESRSPVSIRLARLLWMQGGKKEALDMLDILMQQRPDDARLRQLREDWRQQEGGST